MTTMRRAPHSSRLPLLLALTAGLSCGGSGESVDSSQVELRGAVQKGPFVVGSSVQVSLLDAALSPTGQVFNTQTINDRGEFLISFEAAGPVALEGVGYYYNEVTGALASSDLTLRALYIPSGSGKQQAFVNMITHLTTQRIQTLVTGDGETFAAAVAHAESDLRAALAITLPTFTPALDGIDMNLAGGNTPENAYLLGVSSVLIGVAMQREGSVEANLQELLNRLAIDLADGALEAALRDEIRTALLALDVDRVARQLTARFVAIGVTDAVPDMRQVLDQDGDGKVNALDNCPRVANADQENGDGDPAGDACDACPTKACDDACLPASSADGRPEDLCFVACDAETFACDAGVCRVGVGFIPAARPDPNDPNGVGGGTTPTLCAPACDPLASGACGDGLACCWLQSVTLSEGGWGCAPTALCGASVEGERCTGDTCGPGLVCSGAPTFPYDACRAACLRADGAACGGRDCLAYAPAVGAAVDLCALPAGQLGEACVSRPASTCADAFVCLEAGPESVCVAAGAQGQPCRGDGSCDAELGCIRDDPARCAPIGGVPLRDCCVAIGGQGEPCAADRSCDPGFFCGGPQGCGATSECCVALGGPGARCDSDPSCAEGLACLGPEGCAGPGSRCCQGVGGKGEACQQDRTCDAGFECGGPLGCAGGRAECCVASGAEGLPCGANHTCEGGRECVGPAGCPGELSECCLSVGGLGAPCLAGGTCDAGLLCLGPSGCGEGLTACCQQDPAGGTPCSASHTCAGDFACVPDVGETCPGTLSECCVPTGGAGERCSMGGTCDADLVCAHGGPQGLCPPGSPQCCLAAGGAGERCMPGHTCDPGLACVTAAVCFAGSDGCCYESGGLGQPCNADASCDTPETLACRPGSAEQCAVGSFCCLPPVR